jgi:hypothetical protein
MFCSRFCEGLSQLANHLALAANNKMNGGGTTNHMAHNINNNIKRAVNLLALPDNNPDAFALLSEAMHFRLENVPDKVTTSYLKTIALRCDKYDCGRALRRSGSVWLCAGLEDSTEYDWPRLLYTAYVLSTSRRSLWRRWTL